MNFYRLSNNRCSACPENSIRRLNESETMCNCLGGYMRRTETDVGLPCLRKFRQTTLAYTHTKIYTSFFFMNSFLQKLTYMYLLFIPIVTFKKLIPPSAFNFFFCYNNYISRPLFIINYFSNS